MSYCIVPIRIRNPTIREPNPINPAVAWLTQVHAAPPIIRVEEIINNNVFITI